MDYAAFIRKKIIPQQEIDQWCSYWKFKGFTKVFTNGCFDILHAGHADYLSQARSLGDLLIVGLNSDNSVRRIKGEGRPVNPENARALMLASLLVTDAIILFDEDTPYELIKRIEPDILVKGGDYTRDTIVGADIVEAAGGKVVTIPLTPGFSTTSIIEKLSDQS
ncbi:MAG: D-glycero-beta-D-manno-heptose 1-phosphate adenylyltransferase [Bacteroidales bacterium]